MCILVHLFKNSDATDHYLVSIYDFFNADEMDYEIEDLKESDSHIWVISIEAFGSWFW